jgi:hypothetical protein
MPLVEERREAQQQQRRHSQLTTKTGNQRRQHASPASQTTSRMCVSCGTVLHAQRRLMQGWVVVLSHCRPQLQSRSVTGSCGQETGVRDAGGALSLVLLLQAIAHLSDSQLAPCTPSMLYEPFTVLSTRIGACWPPSLWHNKVFCHYRHSASGGVEGVHPPAQLWFRSEVLGVAVRWVCQWRQQRQVAGQQECVLPVSV